MSKHRTERRLLFAADFDDAVKKVIDLLCESDATAQGKTKAFIVCGWEYEGLGACALFRAIAKLLQSAICDDSDMRKHFGKILHVDCSLWKNKRTMQRAIAEALNLHHLMPIFDKQDEDDDFRGVDDNSREEIPSIGSFINESLRNENFLMVFHYGGVGDIDLAECGIPLFGKGKLLCAYHGRFEVAREKAMLIPSFDNIYISMNFSSNVGTSLDNRIRHVLHEEAVGVTADIGVEGINPAVVLDCFLYSLFLTTQLSENSSGDENGWATHACNYWICDGILGEDRAWEIGDALYPVMLPLGYSSYGTARLLNELGIQRNIRRRKQKVCWWHPVTPGKLGSNKKKTGAKRICNVPDCASSYFLVFQGDEPVYVHNDLFKLASNLRVLKLYNCSFDFASPPFKSCQNLRFLWLEHCTNTGKEESVVPVFANLLVFDLRFTDYILLPQMIELMTNLRELNTKGVAWKAMSHVWKILKKLHKLRLTKSSDVVTMDSCSFIDMMNLELLDLSGNTKMESLPTLSSARSLKMLVLDGCSSLQNVVLEGAPLLESFSFDGYGPAENWTHSIDLPQKELHLKSPIASVEIVQVTKISLQGCGRLQNIYLRALPNLEELDLSYTAIKTLNLNFLGITKLKKLLLLGCDHLCNLSWGWVLQNLKVLHIDTQRKTRSVVCWGEQGSFRAEVFIAFTDGRFISSPIYAVEWIKTYGSCKVYLLVSCRSHSQASITNAIEMIGSSREVLLPTRLFLPYNDIALARDVACSSLVWNRRHLQTLDVHVEIGEGSYNLKSMWNNSYFTRFVGRVRSLHVHDNSSITEVYPVDKESWEWQSLKWCLVERCPKLHSMFSCWREPAFKLITAFSASDLKVVHCIWDRGINVDPNYTRRGCFQQLQHMYLYNCPKLVFVLPISFSLPKLETLQIAYCSNLRHVFPLDDKHTEEIASGVTFKNIKHIKLYHLHNLEQICEARLTAPALQTIGLRDCWGLRRLPSVARQGPRPEVDCEKDWWNRLEWDGLDASHDPSLFKTRHSAYYKKTLPRVSFLR